MALVGKSFIVTGQFHLVLFDLLVGPTHYCRSTLSKSGGARGIGLAFCQAIVSAGGSVGILDILPEPHPDCRALEETGRSHYFT